MAKRDSLYSFSYDWQIEEQRLVIYCKAGEDNLMDKGTELARLAIDMDEVKDLTFTDEDFGGGKDTPYPFGDWLPGHALWVFLSARTSSLKGPDKVAGMKDVLKLLKGGRFNKEREGGPGSAYSYLYAAIAALRTEKGKPTTYKQVAASRKSYNDKQWKVVQEQFGEELPKKIQELKDKDAADDTVDLMD